MTHTFPTSTVVTGMLPYRTRPSFRAQPGPRTPTALCDHHCGNQRLLKYNLCRSLPHTTFIVYEINPEQVKDNLHVKELKIDEERFIVCLNPEQAEKDRQTRDAIVAKLNEKLRQGVKQLVANRGYARFLRIEKDAVMLDADKIEQDQAFDGKYVLTTNTTLSARNVALSYKGLWQVERGFRNLKSALEVRPVFHRTETRVKGHVFASFLALVLMTAMEKKLEQKGIKVCWDDFIRDLRAFRAIKTKFSGKTYQLRTECRGDVANAFRALGLRIPPVIQSV